MKVGRIIAGILLFFLINLLAFGFAWYKHQDEEMSNQHTRGTGSEDTQ